MKSIKSIGITIIVGVLAVGALGWWLLNSPDPREGEDAGLGKPRISRGHGRGNGGVKNRSAGRVSRTGRKGIETKIAPGRRPDFFNIDLEEEKKLTQMQRELLKELRALSDAEDRKGLYALIARMQKSNEWPDGIPSCLHEAAIDALRWIGSDAIPELFGYLGVADPEIHEEAVDALEEMLSDPDRSDFERSQMLKSSLTYLNTVSDTDMLDDLFSDIMEMRNSVKADTIIYLLENGSDTVRNALTDTIELVTGEDDYNSVAKMKEWAADPENRDDPDDDEFYGGLKNSDPDADDAGDADSDADYR